MNTKVQIQNLKSNRTGYILAFFLGGIGLHHFYYKHYIRGVLYLIFSWTYVPIILGWIDMLFVKRWTSQLNNQVTSTFQIGSSNEKPEIYMPLKKEKIVKSTPIKVGLSLFYCEDSIILPKYNHLKTPKHILEAVQNVVKPKKTNDSNIMISYSNSGTEFLKSSAKLANKKGVKTEEVPLQAYWTTFAHFDNKKLKWYLYWRTEVLKGNYIEVDLSYIFVFVYELLNYSFNEKAAFNVSMLERIYENYKVMHPKLENYLPGWIHDMLNELNENELANEWNKKEHQPTLYKRIVDEEKPLDKISITNWRPYIRNNRETIFFTNHKNKIYKVFKSGAVILGEHYKDEGEKIEELWFEMKRTREVVRLYPAAVVGREVEPIHIYTNQIMAKDMIFNQVTALFRLSENIMRDVEGEKRKIKVDIDALPEKFQELMMEKMKGKSRETNERFKKVQSKDHISAGATIPKAPEEIETREIITFNAENISRLNNESQNLQNVFAELESEGSSGDLQSGSENYVIGPSSNTEMNVIKEYYSEKPELEPNSNDSTTSGEHEMNIYFDNTETSEDEEGFINSLSTIEKEFMNTFIDGESKEEDAAQFAKNNGQMLGSFLSGINEKSNSFLGDNIFEIEQEKIIIYEEFTTIIETLKGV